LFPQKALKTTAEQVEIMQLLTQLVILNDPLMILSAAANQRYRLQVR